jgi:hypothetical protein
MIFTNYDIRFTSRWFPPSSDFSATSPPSRCYGTTCRLDVEPRLGLLKIAQQLQCWVRDNANRQSPLRTKEMFCRPWRDFMNGVRLSPAVNCWAIFENSAMTQAIVTEINALLTDINARVTKFNGLFNARNSTINAH